MHNISLCRTSAFNKVGGGGGRVQAKGVEDVLLWVADSNVFFFSDGLQVFSTHLITKK